MIDTPFESWCAQVAYMLNSAPTGDENAQEFLYRVFGASIVSYAYNQDLTPEQFLASLPPPSKSP